MPFSLLLIIFTTLKNKANKNDETEEKEKVHSGAHIEN